ncbi:MAG: hypothetical protein U0793_18650 [Gemmataceae bacterium]
MPNLPITRVVLYKHGVGYFEREGDVEGAGEIALTFKQTEVSDVLKSLTVLDLDGGHIASVSYDSTKPLEQLLAEIAFTIPDHDSWVGLLPKIKGARVALHSGVADPVEGLVLGIDTTERQTGDGVVKVKLLSLLTDAGDVRSFDLHALAAVHFLDPVLRRDLDFYLKTQLSSTRRDARTFTFFAKGQGKRKVRLSYTLEAPVWKATYRILLGEEGKGPMIQGWAVVDNTQDEDWSQVSLSLIAGLPVSFIHDLYTPRYIKRPEVKVQETTGVLPPEMEEAMFAGANLAYAEELGEAQDAAASYAGDAAKVRRGAMRAIPAPAAAPVAMKTAVSSMPTQVRERKIGDLFEYEIEHPVSIRRNQSALVPIVLRGFEGRPVLLYNKRNRAENPMRCVEFKNTTGLTLEGGPVTVLEAGSYVGEAMLETVKPDEERLIPYAVELSVHVLDNIDSHADKVHRVLVRRGVLRTDYVHNIQTTYHFNNKSKDEQIVTLEHPREGKEWKLFGPSEPKEITENYWRFRFTIAPREVTQYVVRQRQTLHQSFQLAQIGDEQIALWLEQRFLDRKTADLLRDVLAKRQEIGVIEGKIQELEKERGTIHADQKRIRENLQSLGDRSTEKELRERFVRTLGQQEDQLETIEREIAHHARERERLHAEMEKQLERIEYDTEVT